jgi:hypothetical protein
MWIGFTNTLIVGFAFIVGFNCGSYSLQHGHKGATDKFDALIKALYTHKESDTRPQQRFG